MNYYILIFTFIILLLCCYKIMEGFNKEIIYVKSNVDQRRYLVQNLPQQQEAADMLAKLRRKLINFTKDIYEKYPTPEVRRLKQRYKPDNLTESTSDSQYTSYNINKGEKIVFCIRERDSTNNLVNENTIFFVALHELAHIMTYSIGHKKEFWDNFKFLLKFAIDNKYYYYEPYHKVPKKYCGTMITDTPYKI